MFDIKGGNNIHLTNAVGYIELEITQINTKSKISA